jgi:nicotinate-nucleotide pyrophosphorylase (carboxylating)
MHNYLTVENINRFIDQALAEDNGNGQVPFWGDHSALSAIPPKASKKAQLLVKQNAVMAGIEMAKHIFNRVDASLDLQIFKQDGDQVEVGEIAFRVEGKAQSILIAERVVLNCMQRMSGIATLTNQYVQAIAHTPCTILDTRKTTPNARLIEKWAVRIGGAKNHRYGLFDMIMLKDNHVDFAGGIAQAIAAAHQYLQEHNQKLPIEIETRSLEEVQQVVEVGGVDFLMLDNMDLPTLREALRLIDGRIKTEASGGITLETLVPIAETGVDFISVGALTHSYKSRDFSLKAIE